MKASRSQLHCPNKKCAYHSTSSIPQKSRFYQRIGTFVTKWNHQPVRRYQCKNCGKSFSSHTYRKTYLQNRPDLNTPIYRLYCSGMSQRRIAKELGCNLKTVVRKFLFMSIQARQAHEGWLNDTGKTLTHIQFDEMESFEHTRLKPLSIPLAVSGDGKYIVDINVGKLAYKGPLAALAFKKYGFRPDTSQNARAQVLQSIEKTAPPNLALVTDAKPAYGPEIKAILKDASHTAIANRRNQIQYATHPTRRRNIGDPLFWLNLVCARIRNDLSRMMRKTWTTTKNPDRLTAHLNLFIAYYNGYSI